MRLFSFNAKETARYGIVSNRGVIDLYARMGDTYPTLRDLLAAGAVSQAEKIAQTAGPDYALEDVSFLPQSQGQRRSFALA
jgi:hypothetical protein